MRIAVLTLTRDRLDYTKHCLGSLYGSAGCEFDHFILDQASKDDTVEWLLDNTEATVFAQDENIGICRALNALLAYAFDPNDYDVIVRYDNDCEVVTQGVLDSLAKLSIDHHAILSPHVHGLNNPPPIMAEFALGDYTLKEPHHLGGIFMVIPASAFKTHGFRYDESQPFALGDELICPWWREKFGWGHVGYVDGFDVNHYETTEGQKARYPEYQARKERELR